MSLSDCEKCWASPCACGWDWIGHNPKRLKSTAEKLLFLAAFEETNPEIFIRLRNMPGSDERDDLLQKIYDVVKTVGEK